MYNYAMEILRSVQSFFTGLPMDRIILGVIVIVIALDSLRSGIGRAISLSIAMPMGLFLYSLADTAVLNWAGGLFSTPFMQAAVFGAIVVGMYLLVRRMGLEYVDSGMGAPVQALLAGAAVTVVFACIWLHEPALGDIWTLSPQVQMVFSEAYRLWWLLGAYIALAFARG